MTEFKRTQIIDVQSSRNLTPDDVYWKRLDHPVTVKQFGFINGLDFSPIPPYHFSVAYSTQVDVYNPLVNRPCVKFTRFKKAAFGGSFRRDGQLFAAGGEDGSVRLFGVARRTMLRLYRGHEGPVHAVKFLLEKEKMASFSDDRTIRLWETSHEQQLTQLNGHTDYVRCGATGHRSSDLLISGSYDHTVKVWDWRRQDNPLNMTLNHGCPVEAVLLFPNDSLVASAGGTVIKIWDLTAGGKLLCKLSNHRKTISCLSLCSENRRLLSGSLDRHVKIYDVANYRVVHTLDFPAPVVKLGISKDDNILAVAMTECLLSIQHRLPEKSAEPKPQRSRSMSYRYLIGKGSYEQADLVVKEEIKKKLPHYDQYLRTFQHKKALDSLLRNHYFAFRRPEVIISLIRELIRRDALQKALSDRKDENLTMLVKFVAKHLSRAPFVATMIDTANALFDIYGDQLHELGPKNLQAFKQLQTAVNQETAQMRHMASLTGALEIVLNLMSAETRTTSTSGHGDYVIIKNDVIAADDVIKNGDDVIVNDERAPLAVTENLRTLLNEESSAATNDDESSQKLMSHDCNTQISLTNIVRKRRLEQ